VTTSSESSPSAPEAHAALQCALAQHGQHMLRGLAAGGAGEGHERDQAPVIVEDRLYPPCCLDCAIAEKWQGIARSHASPAQLAFAIEAKPGDLEHATLEDRIRRSARIQWAADVLSEHRGFKQRPAGCRAWGS
jgi:hypothetical protein